MRSLTVNLEKTSSVKEFVSVTQSYDYDITITSGRYVVDAKSVLGLYSLDTSKPLTVQIYNDNCADLLEKLKKFQ